MPRNAKNIPKASTTGLYALMRSCVEGNRPLNGGPGQGLPIIAFVPALVLVLFRPLETLARGLDLGPDHTILDVIVDQPHGLDKGVGRGGTDEFPTSLFEIF